MRAIWDEIKNQLRAELPGNTFSLWINPITYLGEKGDTITLRCPNKFSRNWVMDNYLKLMQAKLHQAENDHVDFVLKAASERRKTPLPHFLENDKQLLLPNIRERQRKGEIRLNTGFTFDRFVVGLSNEFAYSASKAFSHKDQLDYHTLVLQANTGLGKSHLSQAVGHAILESSPQSRVYYITAEDFTNEMISSLKNNCIEEFKNRYRRCCDVLLLEEIHFLSGKQKTQLELGYTLDALANNNKKIIFTSSLPPKDIPGMSKGLTSRLTSGLVTTIRNPDYQTRVKILEQKSSEQNVTLSEDIIHFLASHLTHDIRQIESAVLCIKAESELLNAKIDLDLAKGVLSSLISAHISITMEDIIKIVCKYYNIDPEMLRAKSRKQIYSCPRNIYVYLCRKHTDNTLGNIGKTINRSHSTVLYATEQVEHKMKTDDRIRHQVNFLSQKLKEMKK